MTGLWGEQTEPLFLVGAKGLGISLDAPLLWAWLVGMRTHFSNPIMTISLIFCSVCYGFDLDSLLYPLHLFII